MLDSALLILLFVAIGIVAVLIARGRAKMRADEFPAISDEEYLRRCGPEIPAEVALGVRKVLSDALGHDEATIYPEHRLIEELGAE